MRKSSNSIGKLQVSLIIGRCAQSHNNGEFVKLLDGKMAKMQRQFCGTSMRHALFLRICATTAVDVTDFTIIYAN